MGNHWAKLFENGTFHQFASTTLMARINLFTLRAVRLPVTLTEVQILCWAWFDVCLTCIILACSVYFTVRSLVFTQKLQNNQNNTIIRQCFKLLNFFTNLWKFFSYPLIFRFIISIYISRSIFCRPGSPTIPCWFDNFSHWIWFGLMRLWTLFWHSSRV